jgi:hypothetical protein
MPNLILISKIGDHEFSVFHFLLVFELDMNYLSKQTSHTLRKGHQDRTKLWHELDLRAKINMLADPQADNMIYRKQPRKTGFFPTWIPGAGTRAALFHTVNNKLPKASLRTFVMQLTCQQ